MDGGGTGKKKKRKNRNLRLVKSGAALPKLRFDKAKRRGVLAAVFGSLLALLVGAACYVITCYKVTDVQVEGNIHYTAEEIMGMVMEGRLGRNSLFLSMKYRDKGIQGVPFIETMDVDIKTKNAIRITVYEKALAGYVRYLDRYVYFDKDGIVVETSKKETAGIPQVTGLSFDHVILHEKLPVDKPELFEEILNITQQLAKYSLSADRIYFDGTYQVTLYFGKARILMGSGDIDEKIMKLQYILPGLLGKSGSLDMREYSEDTKTYSFEQD